MSTDKTTWYVEWHRNNPLSFRAHAARFDNIYTSAVHDEDGSVIRACAVVRDTSIDKAIEQAKALWTERYGWKEPELTWFKVTNEGVFPARVTNPCQEVHFRVHTELHQQTMYAYVQAATADDARRVAREQAHVLADEAFGKGEQP